jgi:hypothetical protein
MAEVWHLQYFIRWEYLDRNFLGCIIFEETHFAPPGSKKVVGVLEKGGENPIILILVTDPPQLMPATDRISCVYFTAPKTDTFSLKSNLPSTTEQW